MCELCPGRCCVIVHWFMCVVGFIILVCNISTTVVSIVCFFMLYLWWLLCCVGVNRFKVGRFIICWLGCCLFFLITCFDCSIRVDWLFYYKVVICVSICSVCRGMV